MSSHQWQWYRTKRGAVCSNQHTQKKTRSACTFARQLAAQTDTLQSDYIVLLNGWVSVFVCVCVMLAFRLIYSECTLIELLGRIMCSLHE